MIFYLFKTRVHISFHSDVVARSFSVVTIFDLRRQNSWDWSLRGTVAKLLDCLIGVNQFELQSLYYIYFRTNTLGKGMNPFIPPSQWWVK